MNKLIITILLLITLCLGQCLDSVATKPFNIDLKEKITDGVLEEIIGFPDTMNILTEIENVHYVYSKKMTCYFLIKGDDFILYAIEITNGDVNGIKIGMSKRKILRLLGEPNELIITKNRIIMEWCTYRDNIVIAKFKNNKLNNLMIAKTNINY